MKKLLPLTLIIFIVVGCDLHNVNARSSNSGEDSTLNTSSKHTRNILFSAPVDVVCLDRFKDSKGLRLSGNDVYYEGYESIQICRHPFQNQFFEKIISSSFVREYAASDEGLLYEREGYVHFLPKVSYGSEKPLSESVGPSEHSWEPEAPFSLATQASGPVALMIGYNAVFYKREPQSSGTEFNWKTVGDGRSSRDRDKLRMGGLGLYTQNKFESQITLSPLTGGAIARLQCPDFCEDMASTVDGVYALSRNGIYFFDGTGNRATIVEPNAAPWASVYSLYGSALGVYVHYRRADDKYLVSFITRGGAEIVIVESDKYISSVVANDRGALVLQERGIQPWRYYEMLVN